MKILWISFWALNIGLLIVLWIIKLITSFIFNLSLNPTIIHFPLGLGLDTNLTLLSPCNVLFELLETKYNRKSFLCYGKEDDDFIFIVTPALRAEVVPLYKYIQDESQNIFIPINKLKDQTCINELKLSIDKQTTIELYLKSFIRLITTNYTRKLPQDELITKVNKTRKNIKKVDKVDLKLQQKIDEQFLDINEANVKKTKKQKANVYFDKKLKTRKTIKQIKKSQSIEDDSLK